MQDSWGHTQGTSSDSFWGPKGARRQPWACKSPSSLRTWHEWQYLEMTKFPDPQQAESRVRRLSQARKTESKLQMKNQINQKKKWQAIRLFFAALPGLQTRKTLYPLQSGHYRPPTPWELGPPAPQLCLDGGWPRAGADTDTRVTFPASRPNRCFTPLHPNERRWKSEGWRRELGGRRLTCPEGPRGAT